jgi:SAM-dependent methyltransferase
VVPEEPAAYRPRFRFFHHDVFNTRFNPGPDKPSTMPFPVPDSHFTLVNALSVFTHLTQDQAVHYLWECARVLHPEGLLHASWFLFDKSDFPMLHEADNALYVSYVHPGDAVIFDHNWVRNTARVGLTICKITIFADAVTTNRTWPGTTGIPASKNGRATISTSAACNGCELR